MGEAALKKETSNLSQLIETISSSGKMTKEDQNRINEAAKMPMQNVDILAIKHLTELIRAGAIKVI